MTNSSNRPGGMFAFTVIWLGQIISVLADFVLEPAARAGTGLPATFAWLVGAGPGAGMGLLLVICGSIAALVGLTGYFVPHIYHAETILPDHDALARAEAA